MWIPEWLLCSFYPIQTILFLPSAHYSPAKMHFAHVIMTKDEFLKDATLPDNGTQSAYLQVSLIKWVYLLVFAFVIAYNE